MCAWRPRDWRSRYKTSYHVSASQLISHRAFSSPWEGEQAMWGWPQMDRNGVKAIPWRWTPPKQRSCFTEVEILASARGTAPVLKKQSERRKQIDSNSQRARPSWWHQTHEPSDVIRDREPLFLFVQLKLGSAIPRNRIFSLSWV